MKTYARATKPLTIKDILSAIQGHYIVWGTLIGAIAEDIPAKEIFRADTLYRITQYLKGGTYSRYIDKVTDDDILKQHNKGIHIHIAQYDDHLLNGQTVFILDFPKPLKGKHSK